LRALWFLSVLLLWLVIFVNTSRNFATDATHRTQPTLDLAYTPSKDVELVVSMYREDAAAVAATISSFQRLFAQKHRSVETTVYVKDSRADAEALTSRLNVTRVVKRPNVGREGETYLYHITSQWEHLARHTFFLQAHVHNLWEVQRRMETYFRNDTGALMLGFPGHTCKCDDCSDRWGWSDGKELGLLYSKVHHERCEEVLLSYKGQFVASAERLRGINRTVYEDLHRNLVDEHARTHGEPYLRGRPDSLNAPFFGYTVERMWAVLLQCSERDVARKCPSLLAGWRRGGDVTDCQCVDART
jgi:hypothetical protein